MTGHKLDLSPGALRVVAGLPLTSPARTLVDLAPLLTVEDIIVAADFLLCWRRPQAAREELQDAISGTGAARGIVKLRAAVRHFSDRADTPPESRLRYRFWRAGLPPATPNIALYGSRGQFLAMPDLTFLEYREVYDYEGDHHRTDPRQWEKDLARVPRLEAEGWHSTRGSRRDLSDTPALIRRLAALLRAKGWDGPSVTTRR